MRATPLLLTALLLLWRPATEAISPERFDALKNRLHLLTVEERELAFAAEEANTAAEKGFDGSPTHATRSPEPPKRQKKIDHFVVLLMENRAADHTFGCMDLPGFDGVSSDPDHPHTIPVDPKNASKGVVNVTCGTANYVCKGGGGYDTFAGHFAPDADTANAPYSGAAGQNDKYSYAHGAKAHAITMFGLSKNASAAGIPPGSHQLSIKHAVAKNFGVFNKYYCGVPSASSPNHIFTQSATSCGVHDNIMYSQCGGKTDTFPQMTIFDSLALNDVDFALYMNSSCGLDGQPCHSVNPHTNDAGSPINVPDVAMTGVGRYKKQFKSQTTFYEQAAAGTLPALSWLMPQQDACDHPCHDMAKGERILKDFYEALRAGPKWQNTLFFVVYDDAGGFYDHVVPPSVGVPADDAPCTLNQTVKCGSGKPFDFKRLGLRSTAMLMSPWVAKGTVFQQATKPEKTSQFEHSSISATIKNLFNLTSFLTKRDAWAGSFDELLLDQPRPDSDMPMHFPAAPKPAAPWLPPPQSAAQAFKASKFDPTFESLPAAEQNQKRRLQQLQGLTGEGPAEQHCGLQRQTCEGQSAVSTKQRNQMQLMSTVTGVPVPSDTEVTSFVEANVWIRARWNEYMSHDRPAQ